MKVRVKFVVYSYTIYAVFPDMIGKQKGMIVCYDLTLGKFTDAPKFMLRIKRATKDEYDLLYKQLERLGYKLEVI